MKSRPFTDFPRSEQGLVDNFIGTAYDTVKRVGDNIPEIQRLDGVIDSINTMAPTIATAAVENAMVPVRVELNQAVVASSTSANQAAASALEAAQSAVESNTQRSIRVAISEPVLPVLPTVSDRSSKALGFDSNGLPIAITPASQVVTDLADPTKGALTVVMPDGTTVAELQELKGILDPTDPAKGVTLVPRATVTVLGVVGLLNLIPAITSSVVAASYLVGEGYGGGHFVWSPTTPKSKHDGGKYISNTVPWNGNFSTLPAFLLGTGETNPTGNGCFVRQGDKFKATSYGCVKDLMRDSAASWSAVWLAAMREKGAVYLPDFAIKVGSPAVLTGDVVNFSTVKLFGTFCTNANGMKVDPTRCGSVVFTAGNPALSLTFNLFSNENYAIKGVGFCDSSFYPAGTPISPNPAISLGRGRLDGSSYRYFSDNILEDVAFVGYQNCMQFTGLTPVSTPSALGLNYIGPTNMKRVSAATCGNFLKLTDCSMNHLWIEDFVLHGLTGFGVYMEKTSGGSGGNVNVTYRNGAFESMLGPINTAGAYVGLTSPGVYARNNLVLDCTNREYTGLYGPEAVSPFFFTGNPLGYVGNTDVVISGLYTKEIAYGERNFTEINSGSSISSTVPVVCLLASDAIVHTPNTVNHMSKQFTMAAPAGTVLDTTIQARSTGIFDIRVKLLFANGAYGFQDIRSAGQVGGIAYRDVTGSKSTGVTLALSQGGAGDCLAISITNGTGFPLDVKVELENLKGAAIIL